jgi:hypothetical protein
MFRYRKTAPCKKVQKNLERMKDRLSEPVNLRFEQFARKVDAALDGT